MTYTFKNHRQLAILAFLLVGVACTQNSGKKANEPNAVVSTPLSMEQTTEGKWVILDNQKTTLYEVFPFDNGPDYPAEGLIRVVKNGKIGFADANTYAIVIEPQFDCAFPFKDGKAKVSNQCKTVKIGEYNSWESEQWQYIDNKGNYVKH